MGLTQKLGLLAQSVQQDTSLNIGIGGAANASYKLQVTGATNLTGALSGTSATFSGNVTINSAASSGKLNIQTANDNGLYIYNGSSASRFMFNNYFGFGIDSMFLQEWNTSNVFQRNVMTFFTGGNVGVGTGGTDAGYKLDVNGTGRFSGALTGTSATFNGTIQSTTTSTNPAFVSILPANSNATILQSYSSNSGFGWKLQQDEVSTGDFRIFRRESSVDYQVLNLARSSGAATFSSSVTATQYGVADGQKFLSNGGTQSYYSPNSGASEIGYQSTLNFRAFNGNSPISAMFMASNGNVGIGTSSPGAGLEVVTDSGVFNALRVVSNRAQSSGTDVAIAFRYLSDSTNYVNGGLIVVGKDNTTSGNQLGNMQFYTNGGSGIVERMRITSGGEVGIGVTPSSGNRFWVKGGTTSSGSTTMLAQNSAGTNTFYVRDDGAVFLRSSYPFTTGSASNMYLDSSGVIQLSVSSLKYKTDVIDYDKGLDYVLKLRPISYKSKNSLTDGDKRFAGLIAEEVHELGLIEFVQYAEDGSPDALAYQNMIALAFKAIQELEARIKQLENK